MRKNKNKEKTIKTRNKYTIEQKESAKKYYLMGLNLQEISKLLDGCPVRTLEKWQLADKWTELRNAEPLASRIKELHDSGKSYNEIAEMLDLNRVTVWRYLKQAKKQTRLTVNK